MRASMLTRSVSKWQDIQIEGSESEGELGGGEQGLGKECVCVCPVKHFWVPHERM